MISQVLLQPWHRLFGHPIDTWWREGSSRRCICGVTERMRWLTDKEIEENDWIA